MWPTAIPNSFHWSHESKGQKYVRRVTGMAINSFLMDITDVRIFKYLYLSYLFRIRTNWSYADKQAQCMQAEK